MNKMLTAVAVSAVTAWAVGYSAIASAEATVYGRVVAGAVYSDNDDGDDDGAWNFGAVGIDGNNGFESSRFGFKGSTDLGNGLEAGFKIEREVEEDNGTSQRHNNVYLSGGFGKVTLGNDSNPYMNARNWDQTNFAGGNWGLGSAYRHEGIKYSMSAGGFSLNVLALANDTNINTDPTKTSSGQREDSTFVDGTGADADSVVEVLGAPMPIDVYDCTTAVAGTTSVAATAAKAADPDTATVAKATVVGLTCRSGTEIQGPTRIDGDAVADVDGNDGIDGWVIHVGYDFGPVALNVAHQADSQDVSLAATTQTRAPDGSADEIAAETAALARETAKNARVVDAAASRDNTAIGVNGSAGPVDWYLAYQTSELNTDNYENDVDSIGGFLGFNMSEKDVLYAYHVAHSADRETYGLNDDNETVITPGEDYTETIFGYSRQIGPGVKFIAEYAGQDNDLADGGDTSQLFFAVKMDF